MGIQCLLLKEPLGYWGLGLGLGLATLVPGVHRGHGTLLLHATFRIWVFTVGPGLGALGVKLDMASVTASTHNFRHCRACTHNL